MFKKMTVLIRMAVVKKSDDTAVCLSLCVGRRGGYGHLVGRTQVLSKLPFLFPFNNIDLEEVERFLDKAPQCGSYYFGFPLWCIRCIRRCDLKGCLLLYFVSSNLVSDLIFSNAAQKKDKHVPSDCCFWCEGSISNLSSCRPPLWQSCLCSQSKTQQLEMRDRAKDSFPV